MAKKQEKAVKEKNKENKVKKHFFKDFKAELKKVIWPTPKQLVNNTIAVITIVIVTSVIVFALDAVFEKMNEYGITKLQSYVVEKFGEKEKSEETDQEEHTHTDSEENTAVETQNNTDAN